MYLEEKEGKVKSYQTTINLEKSKLMLVLMEKDGNVIQREVLKGVGCTSSDG